MKTRVQIILGLFFALFATSSMANSASELTVEQKAIMHLVLSQTSELAIHRMRGATENKVFLHKDGHKEAVYGADGKLVKDGINDGSYNYAHPVKNPFGHYVKDIEPWIMMGASRKDPTSIPERTYAYLGDLEGGIRRARKMWPQVSDGYAAGLQETEFPKAWTEILQHPGTEPLFGLVKGDLEYTDETIISTLKAVNVAFGKVY